jgi:hypothetical protein
MIVKNNKNRRKTREKNRKDEEEDEGNENHGDLLSMAYNQVAFKI